MWLREAVSCKLRIISRPDLPGDGDYHHTEGEFPVAGVQHLHKLDVSTGG